MPESVSATNPAAGGAWGRRVILIGLLSAFVYAFVVNAWVIDDAYITFRSIDNLLHGHGLTWNPGERVQAYTHPLWALLLWPAVAVTGEYFFTALTVSFLLCAAMLLIATRHLGGARWWKPPLFIGLILCSKTVMDYTTSGLETPLSYLLAIAFYVRFFSTADRVKDARHDDATFLFLIAALATVNRYDNLLLYLPALGYLAWRTPGGERGRFLRRALAAATPLWAWVLFALFYYGTPLPNTAYAKMINNGLTLAERVGRGWEYALNAATWDVLGFVVVGAALPAALVKRDRRALAALAGVLLCGVYVVTGAAAATHMSGRFLALPLFAGLFVFARLIDRPATALACAGGMLFSIYYSQLSPLKCGSTFYEVPDQNASRIDAKWFAHEEGGGIFCRDRRKSIPDHVWLRAGSDFRAAPERVRVGGAAGTAAIGYFGFSAGPEKLIIDTCALGDPLLARLPACRTERWVSGHFHRALPTGYAESIEENDNLIKDPPLRSYYEHLRRITRGSLIDGARLRDVILLNLGRFDALLDEYVASAEFAEANAVLRSTLPPPRDPVYPLYLPSVGGE